MRLRTLLPALGLAAALAPAAASAQTPCAPARAGMGVAALPEPWRRAVEALIGASSDAGQPWACHGGVIQLVEHPGGATLTIVSDDGRAISREVATPDDVEPLGEALLAQPIAPPAPPPAPVKLRNDPLVPPPVATESPLAAQLRPPRVLIDAMISPRYAGGSNLMWGGASILAAIPFFGSWSAGAWVRYDAVSVLFDPHSAETIPGHDSDTSFNDFVFGLYGAKSFTAGPIELRAGLTPSLAVVNRSIDHHDDLRVDGRIGADVRAVIPFTPLLRGVVALDGELAPREVGGEHDPDMSKLHFTPYPAYTLGLGIGVEIAPR